MRALAEALDSISQNSVTIYTLSSHNTPPAGRYTTALLDSLHLNPDPNSRGARRAARGGIGQGVLDLIRDAYPAEERLYKHVGETEGGMEKRAVHRDAVVTPLREHRKRERQGQEDADVFLRTALRLVDD